MLHSRCHRGYIVRENGEYDWIDWNCVAHVRATDDYTYGKFEKQLYNTNRKEETFSPPRKVDADGWEEI